MPLYAGEMNLRRGAPLAEYPASLRDVLRTQAEDTRYTNPLSSLGRLSDQRNAAGDIMTDPGDPMRGIPPTFEPAKRLDAATARERIRQERLPLTVPDDGITERSLDLLINAKRDELRRQEVYSRGPGGIGAGAARLGVALVESFLDPLNIASAFVPVVGPARYANMVSGAVGAMGRAAVRARVGAAEGVIGAALLEPLVYGAQVGEQADYTMADSLINIGFGGIFGGGIHVGGGAVRDLLQPGWWRLGESTAAPTPRSEVEAAATPAARALMGPVEIKPNPKAIDALQVAQRIAEADAKPGFMREATDLIAMKQPTSPEIERAVEILKTPGFQRSAEDSIFLKALERGHEADYINTRMARTLEAMQQIDEAALARGNSASSPGAITAKAELAARLQADTARLIDLGKNPMSAAMVMERVTPQTRQSALRAAIAQALEGKALTVDQLIGVDPILRQQSGLSQSDAIMAARGAAQNTPVLAHEPRASELAQEQTATAKPADLESAEADLEFHVKQAQTMSDALGTRDILAELKPFDEAVKRAEAYGKALRAGAACGVA